MPSNHRISRSVASQAASPSRLAHSSLPRPSSELRSHWQSFLLWLEDQKAAALELAMELVETHHIRAARVQDVNDILKRRVTFAARREWIARVRKSGIPPQVWTMTAEEQNEMKTELGWTREDMVNANVRVASLGAQEPEDALEALIAQEELFNATDLDPASVKTLSRRAGKPVYLNSAAQSAGLTKRPRTESVAMQSNAPIPPTAFRYSRRSSVHSRRSTEPQVATRTQTRVFPPPQAPRPARRAKRQPHVDSEPSHASGSMIPLHFVAPHFGEPDYDALDAIGLAAFAGSVCETKIREFYAEACEATILFNRTLPTLTRHQAQRTQQELEHNLKVLAEQKRSDWKAAIDEQVYKYTFEGHKKYHGARPRQKKRGIFRAQGDGHGDGVQRKGSLFSRMIKHVKFAPPAPSSSSEDLGTFSPIRFARDDGAYMRRRNASRW